MLFRKKFNDNRELLFDLYEMDGFTFQSVDENKYQIKYGWRYGELNIYQQLLNNRRHQGKYINNNSTQFTTKGMLNGLSQIINKREYYLNNREYADNKFAGEIHGMCISKLRMIDIETSDYGLYIHGDEVGEHKYINSNENGYEIRIYSNKPRKYPLFTGLNRIKFRYVYSDDNKLIEKDSFESGKILVISDHGMYVTHRQPGTGNIVIFGMPIDGELEKISDNQIQFTTPSNTTIFDTPPNR